MFERRLFKVAACASALLAFSTTASATITASGCIVNGSAATNTFTPTSVAAFLAGCALSTSSSTYTFTMPDNVSLFLYKNPDGTLVTPGSAAQFLATGGGTVLSDPGNVSNLAMSTSSGSSSTWWDIHYTLSTNVNLSGFSITHDDGVVLIVGGSTIISAPGQSPPTATTGNFVGLAGQGVDLLYDECCGLPAVLQANLPGEVAGQVPEPASILLLGTLVTGAMTLLRRRVKG